MVNDEWCDEWYMMSGGNHGRNDEVQISKGKQKGKGFGSCFNVDFEAKSKQHKGKERQGAKVCS